MFRTDAEGNVAGMFDPGDPFIPRPATQLTYEWCNAVQEEIVGVILAAGVTLNKADNAQLLQALEALFRKVSVSAPGTEAAPIINVSARPGTGQMHCLLKAPVGTGGMFARVFQPSTSASLTITINARWDNATGLYYADVPGLPSMRYAFGNDASTIRAYTAPDAAGFESGVFGAMGSVLLEPLAATRGQVLGCAADGVVTLNTTVREDWKTLGASAISSGWSGTVRYARTTSGQVLVRIALQSPSTPWNVTAFTMPSGYLPLEDTIRPVTRLTTDATPAVVTRAVRFLPDGSARFYPASSDLPWPGASTTFAASVDFVSI